VSGLIAAIAFDGAPVAVGAVQAAADVARHRGEPLETFAEGNLAVTALGHPPIAGTRIARADATDPATLVLAGHLYDADDLARSLSLPGDTPHALLLRAAYRRYGPEALPRVDGDFAFVLFDPSRALALLARDAFGMHALTYGCDGRRLVAASEARQVVAAGFDAAPSELAISAYLSKTRHLYGGAQTFYRDVRRVEPGHYVEVSAAGVRATRYWQLDPDRTIPERTEADMAARVRTLMETAVERRVPSGGPYSCALSGGFDSSSVAALFGRAVGGGPNGHALETFSFELNDLESDEPDLIDAVSNDLGTHHHHIYLDKDDVFAVLPDMVAACDEPTFDMGLLYLWRKKEYASRQGVRVMLSGLGGDELFVGQFHFLADLLRAGRLRELWSELRGIYPVDRYTGRRTSLSMLMRAYVLGPLVPRPVKRLGRRIVLGERIVPPWVDRGLAARTDLEARIVAGPERVYRDGYRQDCAEVFRSQLIDVTVPIHEALGQAFGMETRFPLIDRPLVEYMFAVPRNQKIRGGEVRGIQRRAMAGLLPEVVLTRHIKKNINPVLKRQQYDNFLRATEGLMRSSELAAEAYIDADYLRRTATEFLAGRGRDDAALVLWYAMNLEQWLGSRGV